MNNSECNKKIKNASQNLLFDMKWKIKSQGNLFYPFSMFF